MQIIYNLLLLLVIFFFCFFFFLLSSFFFNLAMTPKALAPVRRMVSQVPQSDFPLASHCHFLYLCSGYRSQMIHPIMSLFCLSPPLALFGLRSCKLCDPEYSSSLMFQNSPQNLLLLSTCSRARFSVSPHLSAFPLLSLKPPLSFLNVQCSLLLIKRRFRCHLCPSS